MGRGMSGKLPRRQRGLEKSMQIGPENAKESKKWTFKHFKGNPWLLSAPYSGLL